MLTAPRVSGSRGPQKGVLQGEIISPSIFGFEQTLVAIESIAHTDVSIEQTHKEATAID